MKRAKIDLPKAAMIKKEGGIAMESRPTFPDSPFSNIADLVDPETDKTYRELNAEKHHSIPVGTLVEVQFDDWFGDGAGWKVHARLWVVSHNRDCDQTPLYSLSRWKDCEFAKSVGQCHHGFGEDRLKVIEVTEDLKRGVDALEWPDDHFYVGFVSGMRRHTASWCERSKRSTLGDVES